MTKRGLRMTKRGAQDGKGKAQPGVRAYPDNLYAIVMLSEAKHLAGEWEKSLSLGLRFFAALRMTTTLWFTGVIRIGSK
ncbi:MAG TPA: hypothetical protein VMX13_05830 [Sedimentisphaerales bacterium]|nr:hypothetical protein [Sedimentisphaerales bacterium]